MARRAARPLLLPAPIENAKEEAFRGAARRQHLLHVLRAAVNRQQAVGDVVAVVE